MTLIHHLRPGTVLLNPNITDKWDLFGKMVDAFVSSSSIPPSQRSATLEALIAREKSLSTGMEDGIAVPHAALDGLESMASGIAILPDGIDFQSLDGNPTRIVVTLVVPLNQKLDHLRVLTDVARRLGEAAFREKILLARSAEEILALWADG